MVARLQAVSGLTSPVPPDDILPLKEMFEFSTNEPISAFDNEYAATEYQHNKLSLLTPYLKLFTSCCFKNAVQQQCSGCKRFGV